MPPAPPNISSPERTGNGPPFPRVHHPRRHRCCYLPVAPSSAAPPPRGAFIRRNLLTKRSPAQRCPSPVQLNVRADPAHPTPPHSAAVDQATGRDIIPFPAARMFQLYFLVVCKKQISSQNVRSVRILLCIPGGPFVAGDVVVCL